MCYSKEVQLATSLVLLLLSFVYYLYYSKKYKKSKEKWALPFLCMVILVFVFIGLHQFFEFLSLVTQSVWIYKIGLIISICAVYFLLRSLEILSNKDLYSKLALFIIGIISLHILSVPLQFHATRFFLSHDSAFFWAAGWLFLFTYWHVCAFKIYKELKQDKSKKMLLLYLFAVADLSFILSVIYIITGYFLFSTNVCTEAPSIWCTFYVVQALVLPLLLSLLPYSFKRIKTHTTLSWKEVVVFFLISLMILIILISLLPFFQCLTWKLVFP